MEPVRDLVLTVDAGSFFSCVLLVAILFFITSETAWIFSPSRRDGGSAFVRQYSELFWSVLPALILLLLTLIQNRNSQFAFVL